MFDEKGQIFVAKEDCSMDADELMMLALDAGAEDFAEEEESFEILTDPAAFSEVRLKLEEAGIVMAGMNRRFRECRHTNRKNAGGQRR